MFGARDALSSSILMLVLSFLIALHEIRSRVSLKIWSVVCRELAPGPPPPCVDGDKK